MFQFNLTLDVARLFQEQGILKLSPEENLIPAGKAIDKTTDSVFHIHHVQKIGFQSLGYSSPKSGELTFAEMLGEHEALDIEIPDELIGSQFTPLNQGNPDDQIYLFIDGVIAHRGKILSPTTERELTYVEINYDKTPRTNPEDDISSLRADFIKAQPMH